MITESFKQGVLNRALLLSQNLFGNMVEATGIENFNDLDATQLGEYFDRAIVFLENELLQMGLKFVGTVNILTDGEAINTLLQVRGMFDQEMLHKAISDSEEMRAIFSDTLTNNEYEPDLLITNLIEKMAEQYPHSDAWAKLKEHRFMLYNSTRFITLIQELLDLDPAITDNNTIAISKYLKKVYLHVNRVKETVRKLSAREDIDVNFADVDFRLYDRDINNIPLDDVPLYIDDGNIHVMFKSTVGDTEFMMMHKTRSEHHFEYYISKQIDKPSDIQIAMLVAEYCIPEWPRDIRLALFNGFLEKTAFSNETKMRILMLVRDISNDNSN